jgi:hypothetical protein
MIAGVTAEESAKTATRVPGIFAAFMSTMGPWGIPAAIAAMAAVGIAASGSSAPAVVTNQGTGTVFGDKDAKSESIKNSLDILKDVNTLTMHYSEKMLSSLRSIENLMGGVTNLILRSSGIDAVASGITEGTKLPSVFDFGIVSKIPVVGKLVGSLFGTKTKITGQGVYAEDTKLNDVMSKGIEAGYYVDINKKKKAFGVTYSNKNSTKKTIDDQLSKQFTLIIRNFLDVIKSAAPVLGFTTDQIDANLKDFVVKIGKIDLKGLSGKEIQEKLNAVFGAAGDDMAKTALPGFEKFQQVGEGYLETVVRVAYATESLRGMMDTLGVSTILTVDSAMGLVDAFGGLETAMDKIGAYYDAFYTEAEKEATIRRQLTTEFKKHNLELPKTREEYRKLVEAQDLTTEEGRKMYALLIALAPAFDEVANATERLANARTDIVYRMMEQEALLLEAQGRSAEADKKRREILDKQRAAEYERLMKVNPELARLTAELWALEDATEAARRAAARRQEQEDTARKLFDILTKAVEAEKATLNAQKSTVESTINTLKNIFDILKKNVEDLYGEVDSTILTQANQGRAVISGAISSGVLPDSTLLSDSIEAVRREITTTAYLSKADATKARLIFAAQLELLKGTTEEQLTDAEKQLKAVNAQISYLDNILKTAKEQLDAFLGNTEVLKSVDKALADLYAFLQNPSAAKPVPKPVGRAVGDSNS